LKSFIVFPSLQLQWMIVYSRHPVTDIHMRPAV
jgi:hypothetical protein